MVGIPYLSCFARGAPTSVLAVKFEDNMSILELIIIGIALAMDAFAVSISKGLSVSNVQPKHIIKAALWFGIFQALMPLVGYYLGSTFAHVVEFIDHWIAFVLLSILGFNMIREARKNECERLDSEFTFKVMLLLAIATSIDALAVGVSFAFLHVNIWLAISIIGIITAIISAVGVKIGAIFGCRYKAKAEFAGGVMLILIGIKILFEHLLQ
jgi:putative Mn2+ efflux pump MntP